MKAKKLGKILRDWNEEVESVEQRIEWIQDAQAESQKAILEVIFSETGRNRVSEAHQRITQETERLNGLRDHLHRRATEVDVRISSIEARLQEYVTQPGFEDLIRRVRNLEEGLASMSTQGNADRDRLNDHLAWASTHSHPHDHAEPNQRLEADRAYQQAGAPWAMEEAQDFSPPIGAGADPLCSEKNHDHSSSSCRGPIGGVDREEYKRGLGIGAVKALENSERRVRAFLGQMGWNQESPAMKALIDALYGR